ncbi:MAG: fumarate reductase/succinate dehydrogenase flavoprotein subunit, partial [Actinobacteria bacterium]
PLVPTDSPVFAEAEAAVADRSKRFLSIGGTRSVDWFHRELGKIMIEHCGMARSRRGLEKALSEIPALHEEFWKDLRVLGGDDGLNQSLERAGRVADFFELAELMCRDALDREESCGGHFRVEHHTEDNEAQRDDENFSNVSAWEWDGEGNPQQVHREPLVFEYVTPTQRSYR